LLRAAMEFTAAQMGFTQRLVEKDYFCSVVLAYLAAEDLGLVFKGGTSLAKIHGGFYRLSEDLDFSIAMPTNAARSDRSQRARAAKAAVDALPERLPGFRAIEPLRGSNGSRQYNAIVGYESLVDGHAESIRIEIGLREPCLQPVDACPATTLVRHPVSGQALVKAYPVRCLSYAETMAEKLRAALCRREVAIRDFFDVDHAMLAGFDPAVPQMVDLVRRKLAVPGTLPVDVSDARMQALHAQQEAQLRPVLREQEFVRFDLQRAVAEIRAIAQQLPGP
jgi:predicted nucleotidyltransferase component of viral defense system